MKFIEKIKHLFKKTYPPNTTTTSIYTPIKKEDFEIIEQKSQEQLEKRATADKQLSEYLAKENLRRTKADEKRYEEILKERQIKEKEKNEQQNKSILTNNSIGTISVDEFKVLERERLKQERIGQLKLREQEVRHLEAKNQKEIPEFEIIPNKMDFKRLDGITVDIQKANERGRLKQIHDLNRNETYVEYLQEAEKFRKEFSKNIRCDICGDWENELFTHRGQTYCEKHLPVEINQENVHKVRAGRHGAVQNFIKK